MSDTHPDSEDLWAQRVFLPAVPELRNGAVAGFRTPVVRSVIGRIVLMEEGGGMGAGENVAAVRRLEQAYNARDYDTCERSSRPTSPRTQMDIPKMMVQLGLMPTPGNEGS